MFKTMNGGKLPTRGSKYSAGVDVYANEDVVIGAGETKIVGLGIVIDEDELANSFFINYPDTDYEYNSEYFDSFLSRHYLQVSLRSSLGAKGLILPNGVGIIDLDYKDEIKMIIHNPITDVYAIPVKDINDNLLDNEVIIDGCSEQETFKIKKGDRIGQLLLMKHKGYLFGIESEEERTGGLGSTGR